VIVSVILWWLFIGAVVWMLTCSGLPAEVKLRRMLRGKRTLASHVVIASAVVIVVWPVTAARYIAKRRVWG
jgi:hypothetical protein